VVNKFSEVLLGYQLHQVSV